MVLVSACAPVAGAASASRTNTPRTRVLMWGWNAWGAANLLPRERVAVAEEAAGGAVVWEEDAPDHARGAFADRPAAVAAHVGPRPAGADRVDEDAVGAELRGERSSQGVQRGLRDVVGGRAGAHVAERAAARGHVDDAAVG